MKKIPKKYLIAGGIGLLAVVGLGMVVLCRDVSVPAPNPTTADSKQVANYLASNSFGKLTNDQKMTYMDQLRRRSDFAGPPQGLSREQEENIRRNIGPVFQQRMEKEMEEFSKMTPVQQTAFLDKRIDQMEEFRKNGGPGKNTAKGNDGPPGPPPGGPGAGPGGRPGGPPSRDMMRNMLSTTTPRQRALMTKFMDAMRKRMKERGIKDPGPPGPR